jgi:hypothetical protein
MWILIVLLVIFCLVGLPGVGSHVGWNHSYGYGPSGIGGIILLCLILWFFFGRG